MPREASIIQTWEYDDAPESHDRLGYGAGGGTIGRMEELAPNGQPWKRTRLPEVSRNVQLFGKAVWPTKKLAGAKAQPKRRGPGTAIARANKGP